MAEYVQEKFGTHEGYIRFPDSLDIYHIIWDMVEKRPQRCGKDYGNIEIILPKRREGKSPVSYNYLGVRSQRIIERKIEVMFWAEFRSLIDYMYHSQGVKIFETIIMFMEKYGIESISDDALKKNYYRWRKKVRNEKKRAYFSKKIYPPSVLICP